GGEPILSLRVDAAEDDAVPENHVVGENRALDTDGLPARVDSEQAGDTAATQQAERLGHYLRVPRGLHHEVEAAHVVAYRPERDLRGRDVARTGGSRQLRLRLERRRPHLDAVESEQIRREHADRARADHERALQLPRLPAADCARVTKRAGAHGRRLGENADPPERLRDRDQLRRILAEALAREAVQPCDPALAVVAG